MGTTRRPRSGHFSGVNLYRFRDGKVAEDWNSRVGRDLGDVVNTTAAAIDGRRQ